MGNYYQFVNTGGAMAKMMFVQAKYIVIGENSSSDSDENDNRSDNNDNGDGSSETAWFFSLTSSYHDEPVW